MDHDLTRLHHYRINDHSWFFHRSKSSYETGNGGSRWLSERRGADRGKDRRDGRRSDGQECKVLCQLHWHDLRFHPDQQLFRSARTSSADSRLCDDLCACDHDILDHHIPEIQASAREGRLEGTLRSMGILGTDQSDRRYSGTDLHVAASFRKRLVRRRDRDAGLYAVMESGTGLARIPACVL